MHKDLKQIVRRIRAKGYRVVPAGKHQKVKNAEGKTLFTLPTTPSGQSWRTRLEGELKKRGLI